MLKFPVPNPARLNAVIDDDRRREPVLIGRDFRHLRSPPRPPVIEAEWEEFDTPPNKEDSDEWITTLVYFFLGMMPITALVYLACMKGWI